MSHHDVAEDILNEIEMRESLNHEHYHAAKEVSLAVAIRLGLDPEIAARVLRIDI